MKGAIVLTTIAKPTLLLGYAENLVNFGHESDVAVVVIGDLKTPHEDVRAVIDQVKSLGVRATYLDIEDQKRWLRRFSDLAGVIPYNTDNRRNIGYLISLEDGAEVVVTIDDDNWVCPDEDFWGSHSIVGQHVRLRSVRVSNGWFNNCDLLALEPPVRVYPRGYPVSLRWHDQVTVEQDEGRVVLNLGLWREDPDVDAVTRLALRVRSRGLKEEPVMLSQGTYTPINTQNTAVHKDAMPAFYYVLQGLGLDGLFLDRYGDIWAGLFLKRAVDQIGDRVTVGRPVTVHNRNHHDLLRDLQHELWGMVLTERLVHEVMSVQLTEKSYLGVYREMADAVRRMRLDPRPVVRAYQDRLAGAMDIWSDACERILRG